MLDKWIQPNGFAMIGNGEQEIGSLRMVVHTTNKQGTFFAVMVLGYLGKIGKIVKEIKEGKRKFYP
jgi:hypothetical protein